MLAAGSLLVLNAVNRSATAEGADFCRQTSAQALHSCRAETESDYWLSLGKCDNLPDAAARKECRKQALAALKDARQECKHQYEARQEVCQRLGSAPYDPLINPSGQ